MIIAILSDQTMIANAVKALTASNAVEAKLNASSARCGRLLRHVEAFYRAWCNFAHIALTVVKTLLRYRSKICIYMCVKITHGICHPPTLSGIIIAAQDWYGCFTSPGMHDDSAQAAHLLTRLSRPVQISFLLSPCPAPTHLAPQ